MSKVNCFIGWLLILLPICSFSQGINQAVLEEIKSKASATNSDAVIISHKGEIIYKDFFGKEEMPIYIASAGKSLASLAIGKLIDSGLLDSLDQPVYTIFPQWKQGNKQLITVRMLLNHTSGIQNNPNASIELEPPPDNKVSNIIDLALAAELSEMPGMKVRYNNKAVALIGGIVAKLSGKPFDEFFAEAFYEPMGITEYDWIKDRAGQATTHGAFIIKPSDFLKFGLLMLQNGKYNDRQIISKKWVEQSLQKGQEYTPIWGLLWWRLPNFEHRVIDDEIWNSWKSAGVQDSFLEKMKKLKNKLFHDKFEFYSALKQTLGDNWNQVLHQALPPSSESSKRIYGEEILAYYADGFRGNYLVIIPDAEIVAVRCADHDGFNYETDFFSDFVQLVAKLK